MGPQPNPTSRALFGPFEYDAAAGEIRKHNIRLKLSGQPLQILEMLLERPGEAISREELQQRLWKGTTFVDFENGLNAAISKLRHTLGDSAEQPRYIETVPGRGYRFISLVRQTPRTVLELVPQATEEETGLQDAVVQKPAPAASRRAFPRWTVVGAAGVLVATAVAFVGARFIRPWSTVSGSAVPPVRFRIMITEGIKLSGAQTFSISPDGQTLGYLARRSEGPLQLWVHRLDSLEPRMLPGTVSHSDAGAFWSPDSKFMAYSTDERLLKVDLKGNPPQMIGIVPGIVLGGDWNRDGTIIFGTETSGVMRIDASGGEAVPLITRDPTRGERVNAFPSFLPDGRRFIYSRFSTIADNSGIFVGSLASKPGDPVSKRLVATPFAARFVPAADGHGILLFQRETTVWAQDFDTARLELNGEPKRVADQVGSTRAWGYFDAARGTLIHRSGLGEAGRLRWFDRSGKNMGSAGKGLDVWDTWPAVSPDGTRIAVSKYDDKGVDIWVHDIGRDVSQKITVDPALDVSPIWSPDAQKIAYSSSRAGHFDLYQTGAAGGREELLLSSPDNKFATCWSFDGRVLLFTARSVKQGIGLLRMDTVGGSPTPVPLTNGRANQWGAALSPDSKWIAYVSDESGAAEVYVQHFSSQAPASLEGRPKVQISKGGGTMPHWARNGKEILYRSADETLMSVAVTGTVPFSPGSPTSLFHLPGSGWDVARDGKRFLAGVPVGGESASFTVVMNWQSEWRKWQLP